MAIAKKLGYKVAMRIEIPWGNGDRETRTIDACFLDLRKDQ